MSCKWHRLYLQASHNTAATLPQSSRYGVCLHVCLCPLPAGMAGSQRDVSSDLAGPDSFPCSMSPLILKARFAHMKGMHCCRICCKPGFCVWSQDLVRVERAIWAARLHEKLSDELAHFSFRGTGIVNDLPELSNWLQVGCHCMHRRSRCMPAQMQRQP